jgi:predicted RNase H-like HicB family nuclease
VTDEQFEENRRFAGPSSEWDGRDTSGRLRCIVLADHGGIETLTAIIERERDGFVALYAELDIASQGSSVVEAHANLREAGELVFETADASEVERRRASEVYITRLNVAGG